MKRPCFLFLLAWLAAGACPAQPAVVLDGAQDRYVLDASLALLEDPSRRLWVDDLAPAGCGTSGRARGFQPSSTES